jgi:hypothetical protein
MSLDLNAGSAGWVWLGPTMSWCSQPSFGELEICSPTWFSVVSLLLTEEGLLIVLILSQGYAWGGFQVSWSEDWSKPDGLSRSWRRALISWVFSMLHKWHFILCEGCEVEGWRGQLQYRCIGTPGTHRRWRWCWFSKIGDAHARLMDWTPRLMACTATTDAAAIWMSWP